MLSERQTQILLSLKQFDYLNIKQMQKMHELKSYRNAHRVVCQLQLYMSVFKDDGTNVYYLNKRGRESVNATKIRRKLTTTKHYMMRNDLFIHLEMPDQWKSEIRIKYEKSNNKITVVADAHYIKNNKHYIVEIDNQQTMKKNKIKIDKYRRLIEKGVFKGMPKFIWVTTTSYRQECLLELCEGLDVDVYLESDLK